MNNEILLLDIKQTTIYTIGTQSVYQLHISVPSFARKNNLNVISLTHNEREKRIPGAEETDRPYGTKARSSNARKGNNEGFQD